MNDVEKRFVDRIYIACDRHGDLTSPKKAILLMTYACALADAFKFAHGEAQRITEEEWLSIARDAYALFLKEEGLS